MKVELLDAIDVFKDTNDGYVFGLQECEPFPCYIEWFKTRTERDEVIDKNNFEVI